MNVYPFAPKTLGTTLAVNVTRDGEMWIAECDELGLVTEAESYESLTARAWEIAPELAELDGISVGLEGLSLLFQHYESFPARAAR
ncbi:MAG: DUF1902 domain-containing protein [Gammaproteobacteria bacterium]|nr:DUF1902 domain-containing protein [Gammaproteobacteria bacterium]MBU1653564.1 DUF1902 domain-containing protein [Gammaproteobacteria bacterium]MBU1961906.1 DUF1902 domain-containing protein [Gammaproteobacteria bacterium]